MFSWRKQKPSHWVHSHPMGLETTISTWGSDLDSRMILYTSFFVAPGNDLPFHCRTSSPATKMDDAHSDHQWTFIFYTLFYSLYLYYFFPCWSTYSVFFSFFWRPSTHSSIKSFSVLTGHVFISYCGGSTDATKGSIEAIGCNLERHLHYRNFKPEIWCMHLKRSFYLFNSQRAVHIFQAMTRQIFKPNWLVRTNTAHLIKNSELTWISTNLLVGVPQHLPDCLSWLWWWRPQVSPSLSSSLQPPANQADGEWGQNTVFSPVFLNLDPVFSFWNS